MQCRKLHNEGHQHDIIWFGSYGKNSDGTAKKDPEGVSYVSGQNAVIHSLIPRISIIQGELWYEKSYGIPLLDKYRTKDVFDATLINMILIHPQVSGIKSFLSSVNGHTYSFDVQIKTIYNTDLTLSNTDATSVLYG